MRSEEILELLPEIFQQTCYENSPLSDILFVMQEMHRPAEEALATLPNKFNPHLAPEEFLPFLAYCLQLDWLTNDLEDPEGTGDLRQLLSNASELIHWRGTSYGLVLFLETVFFSGNEANTLRFEIKQNETSDGQPRPFHVVVEAPDQLRHHQDLIEKIIRWEKPAHITYELKFITQVFNSGE